MEVERLQSLEQLEHLNIESNPISDTPTFRKHLILLLPRLKELDGQTISIQDRKEAEIAVQKEKGFI